MGPRGPVWVTENLGLEALDIELALGIWRLAGSIFTAQGERSHDYSPLYREALPSLTVLTRRSAGTLGRRLERPCKWSAALSAA